MKIIELALWLLGHVRRYSDRVRQFFYAVVLAEHRCPKCEGKPRMVREGQCVCTRCKFRFDPTVVFQRCASCGAKLKLRVRRYCCVKCGADARSRFLFDGLVFDAAYFREKMVEHRERKKAQRERVKSMLLECRSAPIDQSPIDLDAVPGLIDALNAMASVAEEGKLPREEQRFNLQRYEQHVLAQLDEDEVHFEGIPALDENGRLDRIWRFIAIIFLAHAGLIDVAQRGQTLWVSKHETDGEGQELSGEHEEADGFEGSECRAATW